MEEASYSVGTVARMTGLTVRTLHHYDSIGLVKAGERRGAGYRFYREADLLRLHRVLCYRELGFSLSQIIDLLREECEPLEHLRRQHQLLLGRMAQLQRMADNVQKTMEAQAMGIHLDPQEMFEVFGEFDPTQHAQEVEQRWGQSEPAKVSRQRTARYGKREWLKIQAEAADIESRLASALGSGLAADSPSARQLAMEHRQHISRWFYDCTPEIHRGLGQMYVADPRFAQHYDRLAPGLATYLCDAILALGE